MQVNETRTKELYVDALHDNIDSVSYKVKANKFVLTLAKSTEMTWYKLKRDAN